MKPNRALRVFTTFNNKGGRVSSTIQFSLEVLPNRLVFNTLPRPYQNLGHFSIYGKCEFQSLLSHFFNLKRIFNLDCIIYLGFEETLCVNLKMIIWNYKTFNLGDFPKESWTIIMLKTKFNSIPN
jgi:hypothetical protein